MSSPRYLVTTALFGQRIPCRYFQTYRNARSFARTRRGARVRVLLSNREWLLLYVLGIVIFAALSAYSLGA